MIPPNPQHLEGEIKVGWKDDNQQRLEGLDVMSPESLAKLEAELVDEFDKMDTGGGTSLQDLSDCASAIAEVREQKASREGTLSDLRSQVHPEGEGEEEPADEEPEPEEASADDEVEEPEEEPQLESVAATGKAVVKRPSLTQVSKVAGKQTPRRSGGLRVATRMIAAGDIPGFGVGQEITSSEQLAQAFVRKLQGLGRSGTPDDVLVASLIKEYPESRRLEPENAAHNDAIMTAALSPKNLVAYGGICEPVAVDYSIDIIGSTARPLRDSLPSYGASRGGVRFNPPPALSSITPPTPWTIAMDTGGTATKSCMVVACGTPQEATVYGIPVCVKVGNMMGKFSPEMIQAQTGLLDVAAARTAEISLLQLIDSGSIALTYTGGTQNLGASRDIFLCVDQIVSSYRYRYRLETETLRCPLPAWVRDLIRADIVMEMAHDSDGLDPRAVAEAQIVNWFNARNVQPVWLLDTIAGLPAQAAGAVNAFPATFVMYLYAEGTWQFLDGGSIDLGVVRDSTLNATNDYQIWREDFEGLAKRGVESLKVTVTTKAMGGSVGTKAPA